MVFINPQDPNCGMDKLWDEVRLMRGIRTVEYECLCGRRGLYNYHEDQEPSKQYAYRKILNDFFMHIGWSRAIADLTLERMFEGDAVKTVRFMLEVNRMYLKMSRPDYEIDVFTPHLGLPYPAYPQR